MREQIFEAGRGQRNLADINPPATPEEQRLAALLDPCARLARLIVWEEGTRGPGGWPVRLPYRDWSPERKHKLFLFFRKLVANESDLGLPELDILRNMGSSVTPSHVSGPIFYEAREDQAFDIFVAHVAHGLYLEITHQVPWSILGRSNVELQEIFSSDRYFHRLVDYPDRLFGVYSTEIFPPAIISHNRDFGPPPRAYFVDEYATLDPRDGFRFVTGATSASGTSLLGPDEATTLRNLTAWFRDNVVHGDFEGVVGTPDFRVTEYLDRAEVAHKALLPGRLAGRIVDGVPGTPVVVGNGCHSAANLLYDLAKSVNIPLLVARSDYQPLARYSSGLSWLFYSHSGLVFRAGGPNTLVLHHVDDIYAYGITSILATDDAGSRPLSPAEADELFFAVNWVPPDTLEDWGFHYLSEVPMMELGGRIEETDFYAIPGSREPLAWGRLMGYWPGRPSDTDSGLDAFSIYSYWRNKALLCSPDQVRLFCRLGESDFHLQTLSSLGAGVHSPLELTPDTFTERIRACVAAHDADGDGNGCPEIADKLRAYDGIRNRNVWRNR